MPVPHRDIRLPAEVVEPLELIVDQRLQGADINRADGFRHIFGEQRQDGKEGGLGSSIRFKKSFITPLFTCQMINITSSS